jgi:hypothetical protein
LVGWNYLIKRNSDKEEFRYKEELSGVKERKCKVTIFFSSLGTGISQKQARLKHSNQHVTEFNNVGTMFSFG